MVVTNKPANAGKEFIPMKFAQMNRDTQYLVATLLYTLEERIEKTEKECLNPADITMSIMIVGHLLHGDNFAVNLEGEMLHGLMESDLGKNKISSIQNADPEHKKREARATVEIEFTDYVHRDLPLIKIVWENMGEGLIETMRHQIAILDEKYEGVDIRQNLRDIEQMKKLAIEFKS